MTHIRLGVNIDHVATVRNARGGSHPDPVRAAQLAMEAGADGITAHLENLLRALKVDLAVEAVERVRGLDTDDQGNGRMAAVMEAQGMLPFEQATKH